MRGPSLMTYHGYQGLGRHRLDAMTLRSDVKVTGARLSGSPGPVDIMMGAPRSPAPPGPAHTALIRSHTCYPSSGPHWLESHHVTLARPINGLKRIVSKVGSRYILQHH